MAAYDYDIVIVGSGFGGSVSALRLAEKGWRVAVLEQGRELSDTDIAAAGKDAKKLAWAPALGLRGFFAQDVFRHVAIVRGIGVGGGSLVYAAVLLEPKEAFYKDPAWRALSPDWRQELAPHYDTAKRMLGRTPNPYHGIQDDWLRGAAERMGAAGSFDTVPQGIFFGDPARPRQQQVQQDDGGVMVARALAGGEVNEGRKNLVGAARIARRGPDPELIDRAQAGQSRVSGPPPRNAVRIEPLDESRPVAERVRAMHR